MNAVERKAPAAGVTTNVNRWGAADQLKALAIVGVLLIHVSSGGYNSRLGSFDWYSALFWGSISRSSVPIFLMVSGALTLDPDYPLSWKKLWTRKIPRLAAALLFWTFAYQLRTVLLAPGGITAGALVQAVKNTLLARYEYHLYYLFLILLVYALLPVTRLIAAHADPKTMAYLLTLWAALGIFYPTLNGVWPIKLITGTPTQYALTLAYTSVGYGLLGWTIRKRAKTVRPWQLMAAAGFLLTFGGVVICSLHAGQLVDVPFRGNSPGVALLGAGLCGWAFAKNAPSPRWVSTLSRASFCIYLVHVFFLYGLRDLGLTAATGPCALFIPLTAAAALAGSFLVWGLLSHIPVVKDWLI